MAASRRDEVTEEVRWLLSWDVVPEEIARRLGYASVESLRRVLDRYGEHQLSVELYNRQVTYIECQIGVQSVLRTRTTAH